MDKLLHVLVAFTLSRFIHPALVLLLGAAKEVHDLANGGTPRESALDMLANVIGVIL